MNYLNVNSVDEDNYSGSYESHRFEQYKIYLEMTDRISSRRQSANSFFVTINTLLITLAAYATAEANRDTFFSIVISLSGALTCYIWYRLILSYKNLNSAKFKVIHAIEKSLPYRLFDAEWDAVGRGANKKLYQPFTHLEMWVPWIFLAIHVLVFLYVLIWVELLHSCVQP